MILQHHHGLHAKHQVTIDRGYTIQHAHILRIVAHDGEGHRWTLTINREDAKALSALLLMLQFTTHNDPLPNGPSTE
jgi:hypothetical protein